MTCKRTTRTHLVDGEPWRSWYLVGPAGIAEFTAAPSPSGTGWVGTSLGLHTPCPQYPGHEPEDSCLLMDGVTCYFDCFAWAASLLARAWGDAGDDEVIWQSLAGEYAEAERLAARPVGW